MNPWDLVLNMLGWLAAVAVAVVIGALVVSATVNGIIKPTRVALRKRRIRKGLRAEHHIIKSGVGLDDGKWEHP